MKASTSTGGAALRWRTPALLVVVGGAVVAGIALLERDPVLLVLAFPLLLAPAAGLLDAPARDAAATLRWASEGASDEVTLRGRIGAPPGISPASIDLLFYRPEPLEETAPTECRPSTDSVEFTVRWRSPFPCLVTIPKPELWWRDRLGLVERRLDLTGDALPVERFPPELLRVGAVRLRRTAPVPGEVRSRTVGGSGDFFAIRVFGPSDTPRQINWRASSRAGRLLANEYLLERTGDLLLLLDLRPSSLGAVRDQNLLSISRAAALGIATGFLAEKSRVGLALFDEFVTAVPLGTGRLQRFRIERALESARLAETPGPSERFAVSLRRYFPPGVTSVLLSPLADDGAVSLLSHLRRRGFPTIVLSPSPLPLVTPSAATRTPDDALALRLLDLLRRRRLGQVWEESPVVDWTNYWSLAPFARFLTTPSRAGGRR